MAKQRGNNEGSIYQRSDGRWVGAISLDDGKRKAFYGKTRNEVSRKVARALHELEQGVSPADDQQTVKDFLQRWLENTAKPKVRYSTYRSYEQLVRVHLVPELGSIRLSKLTPDDIEGFINAKLDSGLSTRTVQYCHMVLKIALKSAVRKQTIPRNVATLVDAPTVSRDPVKPLTLTEAKALLAAAVGDPLEPLYVLTLTLGLRRGEVCGLKWKDFDQESARLHIRRALQPQKGKGLVAVDPKSRTSRRALPLPPFVIATLNSHRKRQAALRLTVGPDWRGEDKDEGWIFTMEDGRPVSPDYVGKEFPRLVKKAKLRHVRFHDLRHSCASFLLAKGCQMRLIMEILGHSQISLTANTYTHLLPEGDRQAADAMQSIFG